MTAIRVPSCRQGQTGMGQGGYTAYRFVQAIGEPVTIALKNPIPLEVDLDVVHQRDCWHLVDPATPDAVILEATRWQANYPSTEPVTVDQAEIARAGFPVLPDEHPAPHCLSCGLGERSLRVQAGPLGDGRFATPFRAPEWTVTDGAVDLSLLWMAMDCSCGWYISHSVPEKRQAVTVQFAVEVHEPIHVAQDYALVAWNGDHEPGWDGRKRGAAASLFAADGTCVAQSRSFWVATQ